MIMSNFFDFSDKKNSDKAYNKIVCLQLPTYPLFSSYPKNFIGFSGGFFLSFFNDCALQCG